MRLGKKEDIPPVDFSQPVTGDLDVPPLAPPGQQPQQNIIQQKQLSQPLEFSFTLKVTSDMQYQEVLTFIYNTSMSNGIAVEKIEMKPAQQ